MSGTDVDRCLDFGARRPAVVLMSCYWQKPQLPMASRAWKWEVTSDRAELVACLTTTSPLLRRRSVLDWVGFSQPLLEAANCRHVT